MDIYKQWTLGLHLFLWWGVALLVRMRQNLRVSLGAVVLALATLAAVIFALINFDHVPFRVGVRRVAWLDTDHGIQAAGFLLILPRIARIYARRCPADGH